MDNIRIPDFSLLKGEIRFSASRSGGAGGQHVNKVNTKVILSFDIPQSKILSDEEKTTLLEKLKRKLNKEGTLMISAEETRSQGSNKELAKAKFDQLVASAFKKRRARKPTKPTKASVAKRLDHKRARSEKKQWRKNLD